MDFTKMGWGRIQGGEKRGGDANRAGAQILSRIDKWKTN